MKRGFSLVEIIVAIVLIMVVGTSATVFIVRQNNQNDLKNVTNAILNATKVFVNTENDEDGKNYNKEVLNGRKGVAVPLQKLVKTGYIKEEDANKIYDKVDIPEGSSDHYILYLQGGESVDYCEEGQIALLPSWENLEEPIYLCENESVDSEDLGEEETSEVEKITLIDEIRDSYTRLYNEIQTNESYTFGYYWVTRDPNVLRNAPYKSGIFKREINDSKYYYFRGNIEYNYVIIYGYSFRILGFDENYVDLITTNHIDGYYSSYVSPDSDYSGAGFLKSRADNAINYWFENVFLSEMNGFIDGNSLEDNFFVKVNDENYVTLLSVDEARFAGVPTVEDIAGEDGPIYHDLFITANVGWYWDGSSELFAFSENYLTCEDSCNTLLSDNYGLSTDEEYSYGTLVFLNYANFGLWGQTTTFNPYNALTQKKVFSSGTTNYYAKLRPVIRLKNDCVSFSGKGLKSDPYIVSPSDECGFYASGY